MKKKPLNIYRKDLIGFCCSFLNFFFANHEAYDDSLSATAALEFYRALSSAASFVAFCSRQDKRNYFKAYGVDIDYVRVFCLIPLNDILIYE